MMDEITSTTSPDLKVLDEVLHSPIVQGRTMAQHVMEQLNARGWFIVPEDQVKNESNPFFTEMQLGQIYMLARTDIEDTSEEVGIQVHEERYDDAIRSLRMLRLSQAVAEKTEAFATIRPELEP